ncbi:MAG: response regulator [Campylobacterota bacterium]|nr:response regulator [Campylobacterota bacterium]
MKTILVVDDTKVNIQILMELLGDDYDILACRDGETAIEMAQEDKPDLILLDIMMPKMDGFEVCEKLKEKPDTKEIPIIFLTAMSDEDSIEKAYDIGGSNYVTKPFKPKELLARVKRELELQELQMN